MITIGKERLLCAEALCHSGYLGLSAVGISDTLYSFILKCDVDLRKDL